MHVARGTRIGSVVMRVLSAGCEVGAGRDTGAGCDGGTRRETGAGCC